MTTAPGFRPLIALAFCLQNAPLRWLLAAAALAAKCFPTCHRCSAVPPHRTTCTTTARCWLRTSAATAPTPTARCLRATSAPTTATTAAVWRTAAVRCCVRDTDGRRRQRWRRDKSFRDTWPAAGARVLVPRVCWCIDCLARASIGNRSRPAGGPPPKPTIKNESTLQRAQAMRRQTAVPLLIDSNAKTAVLRAKLSVCRQPNKP